MMLPRGGRILLLTHDTRSCLPLVRGTAAVDLDLYVLQTLNTCYTGSCLPLARGTAAAVDLPVRTPNCEPGPTVAALIVLNCFLPGTAYCCTPDDFDLNLT